MGRPALAYVIRERKVCYDVDDSMDMLACGVDTSRTKRGFCSHKTKGRSSPSTGHLRSSPSVRLMWHRSIQNTTYLLKPSACVHSYRCGSFDVIVLSFVDVI